MSEAPGEVPSLRTAEDMHAFVRQLKAESRALAADVGDLSRPMAAGETLAPTGEVDLVIEKNRFGPTARVTVTAQLHYSRFVDMAQT